MPLALTARFIIDPKGILASRWTHDMAHRLVAARAGFVRAAQHAACVASQPAL